ncbi:MAG: hypothetical protein L6R37_000677 [Teloschistes peruensis]|nr:MAG: hypothetical protein L6R37_000677 [Teloschistes peruensis]
MIDFKISEAWQVAWIYLFITPYWCVFDNAACQSSMQPLRTLARLHLAGSANRNAFRSFSKSRVAMSVGAAETDTQAATTANTSGITASSIQEALKEKLQAEHVDIEDMSGTHFSHRFVGVKLEGLRRWLRPSFQCHDRFPTVREEKHFGTASTSQLGAESGNCRDTCLDAQVFHSRRMAEEAE